MQEILKCFCLLAKWYSPYLISCSVILTAYVNYLNSKEKRKEERRKHKREFNQRYNDYHSRISKGQYVGRQDIEMTKALKQVKGKAEAKSNFCKVVLLFNTERKAKGMEQYSNTFINSIKEMAK